jgi:predicted DNA-binding transcriptional regulator YafY
MRADRLLAIMLLLQSRGKMKAVSLAAELGVSRRTILRDIEALSISGVPIYAEGGHGGGITLDEGYRTNLTGLQEEEARTLFLASNESLLKQLKLGEAAERTLLKLSAALPTRHQAAVQHIRQRILIDPSWWWQDSQPPHFWEPLQQAVYEDRCVRVLYERYDGEVVEHILEPYSLVAKSSIWYLVAKREQEFRIYRVTRLHDFTLLGHTFERDATYDLPTFWQSHLQEFVDSMAEVSVTLEVHPERLHFVKWLTPGRHQVDEPAGEDGWYTVDVQMESVELAKMLVFGLGSQARVVEPRSLYDAVVAAARHFAQAPKNQICSEQIF